MYTLFLKFTILILGSGAEKSGCCVFLCSLQLFSYLKLFSKFDLVEAISSYHNLNCFSYVLVQDRCSVGCCVAAVGPPRWGAEWFGGVVVLPLVGSCMELFSCAIVVCCLCGHMWSLVKLVSIKPSLQPKLVQFSYMLVRFSHYVDCCISAVNISIIECSASA